MSRKGAALQKDVPWRGTAAKPIPKIHRSPILRVPQNPYSAYALSVMKHDDPIGSGLGKEAVVEAAGPDCIVPGLTVPINLLGLKAWPIEIEVDLKFLEPVGRELKSVGRELESVSKEVEMRKGPWLDEEDDQLAAAVALFGDRRWDALAKASGLKRNGKSCRLRWMNYLRPNLKHGNISIEEEQIIIQLHHKWGNRWSKIARKLPGRTDNEIKNYWRSYSKKNAPHHEKESLSSTNTSSRSECSIKIHDTSDESMGVTRSPYEARLTEWMSNWPPNTKDDDIFNYKICSPESISGDCMWDISLWDGE